MSSNRAGTSKGSRPKGVNPLQPKFIVERIINRWDGKGKTWYKVKWLGWPPSRNTWEPEAALLEPCKAMIDEFNETNQVILDNQLPSALKYDSDEDESGGSSKSRNKRKRTDNKSRFSKKAKTESGVKVEDMQTETGQSDGDSEHVPTDSKRDPTDPHFKVPADVKIKIEAHSDDDNNTGDEAEGDDAAANDDKVQNYTEEELDDMISENVIWVQLPGAFKPRRVIQVIPLGTNFIYHIELERDSDNRFVSILGTTFKEAYPELVIKYYEEQILWTRDPEQVRYKQTSASAPVQGTSSGVRCSK